VHGRVIHHDFGRHERRTSTKITRVWGGRGNNEEERKTHASLTEKKGQAKAQTKQASSGHAWRPGVERNRNGKGKLKTVEREAEEGSMRIRALLNRVLSAEQER